MAKLIVICGATGQLGGSAARRMLKEGWRVRAITRNAQGQAAKALVAQGAEITSADYDDEESLVKAFKDANAIFAVTNFWEHVFALGQEGAGQKEYEQMLKIASAASKTTTLEHLILHTLASGEKLAGKEYACAHWDYKDKAADKIKESMPELASKTTFLWVGFFASNMWTLLKPMEVPGSYGAHILLLPCKPETIMWVTDIEQNVGSFVNAILRKPSVSLPAKVANVATEGPQLKDVLVQWSEVSGKRAQFVTVNPQEYEGIYGIFGNELHSQLKLNEVAPDWTKAHPGEVIGAKELGIPAGELLTLKQSFEANKEKL